MVIWRNTWKVMDGLNESALLFLDQRLLIVRNIRDRQTFHPITEGP
jgi:hypothetical protein